MSESDYQRIGYISYSAMARSPMVWGIPFMALLSIGTGSLLLGYVSSFLFGLAGYLFALIAIPVLLFIKQISVTDDKAFNILLLEVKWKLIKSLTGNSKFYGGAMMIAPVSYGRKVSDVKQFIEKTVSR